MLVGLLLDSYADTGANWDAIGVGAAGQLVDATPAGDHRQVGGQAAVAAELAEDGVVVGDDL